MRASTDIKSIPASETRISASTTIPLSRTRSRTSIKLAPGARRMSAATASVHLPDLRARTLQRPGRMVPFTGVIWGVDSYHVPTPQPCTWKIHVDRVTVLVTCPQTL
jgi:hypothetical protein